VDAIKLKLLAALQIGGDDLRRLTNRISDIDDFGRHKVDRVSEIYCTEHGTPKTNYETAERRLKRGFTKAVA
jgi:hypothetical protein